MSCGVHIALSLAFALYGIAKGDFVAVSLVYVVLLVVCVLYLSCQRRGSLLLRSALTKRIDRLEDLE